MINASTSSSHNTPPTTNIIFETTNLNEDTGLLIIENKEDDKYEVRLYNTFTDESMIMTISDVSELTKMCGALIDHIEKIIEI